MGIRKPGGTGYTLIELMIVVSIIGILSAIAIPKFADMVRRSKEGSTLGCLGTFRSALSIYVADNEGLYPQGISLLTVGGKYMGANPTLRLPPYHDDSSVSFNGAGITPYDPIVLAVAIHGAMMSSEANPSIEWSYIYWGDSLGWNTGGLALIGCTHTDSKGSVWSAY